MYHSSGSYSKPHLDPTAVLNLATSVPNCSRVTPPKDERPLAPSRSFAAAHHHPTAGCTTSDSASSYFSVGESASYFSSIRSRLRETFSVDGDDDDDDDCAATAEEDLVGPAATGVLSFLVSDAYSVERLAAEAEGRRTGTSELEGAGVVRVDVYWQSNSVIACRVIRKKNSGG